MHICTKQNSGGGGILQNLRLRSFKYSFGVGCFFWLRARGQSFLFLSLGFLSFHFGFCCIKRKSKNSLVVLVTGFHSEMAFSSSIIRSAPSPVLDADAFRPSDSAKVRLRPLIVWTISTYIQQSSSDQLFSSEYWILLIKRFGVIRTSCSISVSLHLIIWSNLCYTYIIIVDLHTSTWMCVFLYIWMVIIYQVLNFFLVARMH